MSLKTAKKEFINRNNISLYQNELSLKDKEISILKNKIKKLIFNKNSLISQMDKSLNKRSFPSSIKVSPQSNNTHKKIYSSFQTLPSENSVTKDNLKLNLKLGDKFNNTYQFKLLSAQKEIENLTIMNTNKDNIIMNMQNFINNLNNIFCRGKINLNINKIDIRTFIYNLKKLEEKIIKKLHKIPKPNKIPESIIKKITDNPIKKQNTENIIVKKKQLYLYPLYKRNNNNKILTQTNINRNDNSLKKINATYQTIYTKNKIKDWKDIIDSDGRYYSFQKKKNVRENTLKLKRMFLLNTKEIYNKGLSQKNRKSIDYKCYNVPLKSTTNEFSLSRLLLNENTNLNGGLYKRLNDKL